MMDLFQLFNMEEEVEVQVEKKAATKKAAATKEAKKAASKGGTVTPKKPAVSNSLEGINAETVVRHPAFADIPLTEWFTVEEIEKGIGKMEEDELKISTITGEDVRMKLEPQFPSFVAGLTTIVYDQASNTLHPIITAGRKGAPEIHGAPFSLHDLLPGGKLPQSLLLDFTAIARKIAKLHGAEVHADIYWTGEKYIMDFPPQVIHPYWVQPDTCVALQIAYRKVGEIHSHHVLEAMPSSQDDRSERGLLLYFIVGRTDKLFPDVFARTCWNGRHIKIDPTMLFQDDYVPANLADYDLSGVITHEQAMEHMEF